MNVSELSTAAQSLSYEQRKELIKSLFAQQPKPASDQANIVWVGDLEAGSQEIREQINAALERSAQAFHAADVAP